MSPKNVDVRESAKEAKIWFWQISEKLGIRDSEFSVMLRKELDRNTKQKVMTAIEELKRERCLVR